MLLAEGAVIVALVIVAGHLVAIAPDRHSPLPGWVGMTAQPPGRQALSGLVVDATYWRSRLAELNSGEAAFEPLEWQVVHSAMDAAHRYLESVVLPSIARSERGPG
jgi:hypothetical protein